MWITDMNDDQIDFPRDIGGIRFECKADQISTLKKTIASYFQELQISPATVSQINPNTKTYQISLASPLNDTDTLTLASRRDLDIHPETVVLPSFFGFNLVQTVSKKEIVLALLQHGRTTVFKNSHCRVEALQDHVNVRQNIVSWAQTLEWIWPDGGPAQWNISYWNKGTPVAGHALTTALMDIFLDQSKYAVGCYTATKFVIVHGTLDYYHRVKKDRKKLKKLQGILMADGEPLVAIEPPAMWYFEESYDRKQSQQQGKLLDIHYRIPPNNFVPGDWAYVLNTDNKSAQKTGYEGSNALYLGGNRFADFYNDHDHAFSLEEKLDKVYQWRFGVFNRQRDRQNIRVLSDVEADQLRQIPQNGGLLLDHRATPKIN